MPVKFDNTLMRLVKDVNEIKSALRRTVANLPLFDIANENTPTVLTTNQNNYVPGNYDILRIASTSNVSITGIANGKKGRRLQLFNIGLYSITLTHQSSSSLAANRFDFVNDSDFIIPPSGNVMLYYDATLEYWIGGDMASIYDVVNEVTPSQITADQNNYDIGLAEVLRLSTDANRTITGFSGGVKGRFLEILNVGSYRITIPNENTSSSAANRVITPYEQSVVLLPDSRTNLYYDSTQQRWTVADLPNIQGEFGKYAVLASGTPATPFQTITASTYTRLDPPSVVTDEWGYWDSTNKKFVIPTGERGFYTAVLSFQMAGTAFGSSFYASISPSLNPINSSDPSGTFQNFARYEWYSTLGTYSFYVALTWSFRLVAGDAITFYINHTNGSGNLRLDSQVSTAPVLTFQKTG